MALAIATILVTQPGGNGREPSSDGGSAESVEAASPKATLESEEDTSAPEHLIAGVGDDAYWVRIALADIHRACGGAAEAEAAETEIETLGPGHGNVRRAVDGAVDVIAYGGLVEEGIDHLVRIYRAHPDAYYGSKPMRLVMLDAAADLGNGSCNQSGAERIAREVEANDGP